MKKSFITLASVAAIAVGCQVESIGEAGTSDGASSFEVATEVFTPSTKTLMTAERTVVWSAGDRLAIFQGSTVADEYVVTSESVGKTNGNVTIVEDNSTVNGDFTTGTELSCNVAYYPYSSGLTLSGASLDGTSTCEIDGVVLPATQTYAAGSFGNGAFPMVSVTETIADHTLKFKNVLGAMKLSLKGTQTVKSIKIEGNNSEKLSGAATVTAYIDGTAPALTMASDAATSVTLDCGATGVQLTESAATDFIIALPPVLFSKGFKVTVTCTDDTEIPFSTSTANTVLRSSILVMPTVILGEDATEDENGDDSDIILVDNVSIMYSSLIRTSLTVAPGMKFTFTAEATPTDATDKTITWSSSDATVATIDQDGNVEIIANGTATINAVAAGGATGSCAVTVKQATATVDYVDEYGINHGKGVALGDHVWAPVNCGYREAYTENGTDYKGFPYGKLYQWGRKYGQGLGDGYDDGVMTTSEGSVTLEEGESQSNENRFFSNPRFPYDWLSTRDATLWNSGTSSAPVKTAYDPCPTGWRVPTLDELSNLKNHYSSWTTNNSNQNGYYFSGDYDYIDGCPQIFLPASGGRSYHGTPNDVDQYGRYWSSTPYESYDFASLLNLWSGNVSTGGNPRGNGYSVRCLQDNMSLQ